MNVSILNFEETIDETIKLLREIKVDNKNNNHIKNIKIEINKYWMNDYYDTEFKVDYNIGGD